MFLLNRGTVSASTLAERFEVSKRTIQRDIDTLNQAGIPIISVYGVEGGYEIMDGFKLTKQIAGVDDYLNIIIALKGLSTAYESQTINKTLDKALYAMQGGEQRIFIDFSTAREGTLVNGYLHIIEKAIYEKTLLIIEYSNAENVSTVRIVEPLALSFRWYAWYLFAYCTKKKDYRVFKLQRIASCEPTIGNFSKDHGDIELLLKDKSMFDKREYLNIRLLCKKQIRQQVLEYLNGNIEQEYENGDFIITMNVPFERMWFSLLLGFGNQVQVLEPAELKTMLKQKAEDILSIY
jgi:predicted DNA-binding transcriptional regulator YafY